MFFLRFYGGAYVKNFVKNVIFDKNQPKNPKKTPKIDKKQQKTAKNRKILFFSLNEHTAGKSLFECEKHKRVGCERFFMQNRKTLSEFSLFSKVKFYSQKMKKIAKKHGFFAFIRIEVLKFFEKK